MTAVNLATFEFHKRAQWLVEKTPIWFISPQKNTQTESWYCVESSLHK